ncbi:MAG: hypothetical protein AABP62_29210 [Planctomycetota bacterium]
MAKVIEKQKKKNFGQRTFFWLQKTNVQCIMLHVSIAMKGLNAIDGKYGRSLPWAMDS